MSMDIHSSRVLPISIEDEMKNSYIDYAMSVIVSRALPDVRDGLKPVHRRILYAMHEANMMHNKPYKKSARIVGEVLGKFHPHGDSSVYDAIVRLAQNFSTRYLLVDGHGNFGSIDGDSAAAMRYTEVRMSKIAESILEDIEKDTVDFCSNYDESLIEPIVLPAKIPNLLVNGSSGIAVGMSTNIPPHNLAEIIDGTILLIDNPEIESIDLMNVIKGPDFPTGAIILGSEGIRQAYTTGRGIIKVRAKSHIEETNTGKIRIVITEIPYQINKTRLIENIAYLVKEKIIEGISDLRDESDRAGMCIVIELRKDINYEVFLNQLYKHTALQCSFGIIMLALVDGRPKIMNIKEILAHYIQHQKNIIIKRSQFDLDEARGREHILQGFIIALNNIDKVIFSIRSCKTTELAKIGLSEQFSLSNKQSQAILEIRLQKLTGLEREKIDEEYKKISESISHLESILKDDDMVLNILKEELAEKKKKFADSRRTKIIDNIAPISVEDLIPEEEILISLSHHGYIKRQAPATYRLQKRGGRGVTGMTTRDDDIVMDIFSATTHHNIMFFTNTGKVYRIKGYQIPETSRVAKGMAIVNLLSLDVEEKITATIPVREFVNNKYLFMTTKAGIVKKTELSAFANNRKSGLIAIHLDNNDELISVKLTNGNQNIILGSKKAMVIQFNEKEVRSTGRGARGVKGISLLRNDYIVGVDVIKDEKYLLTVTVNGYGKRTKISEYKNQKRGGRGLINNRLTKKIGEVVGVRMVNKNHELMIITKNGIIIKTPVNEVLVYNRVTQGVKVINLENNDLVSSFALLEAEISENV